MDIQTTGIMDWLISQGASVTIMGIIIWWLVKKYEKVDNEKSELAKDIIKLTTLYETKTEFDRQANAEIRSLLSEIRDNLIKNGRN